MLFIGGKLMRKYKKNLARFHCQKDFSKLNIIPKKLLTVVDALMQDWSSRLNLSNHSFPAAQKMECGK
jgi:hypothetical protein